ncbi:chromosome partitioning protein ParB [Profundibacter sp.]
MADNQIKRIALAEIKVRDDRVTPLNDDAVRLIMQSAEETGEIRDPIHLRKVKGGFELIDGRHRLEVARRLGHDDILAQIWSCTLEQARLMEADANVTFTHMGAVDLAVSLAERKRAYQKLHPETTAGIAGASARWNMQATEMSFASFISEILGVSRRQIERVVAAGEALDQAAVIALRKAPKRVAMADLYEIAKVDGPDEHAYIVKSLVSGEAKNAAAARRSYAAEANGAKPTPKDPVEEAFKALLTAWKRAPKVAQRRFVAASQKEIYPLIVAANLGGDTE